MADNAPAEPKAKEEESSSGAAKLLGANITLAVWLVFLAVGGGLIALYYARIGYLPEIDWKISLVYLFVASIIGGAVGVLLALSVFIPGFIWSELIVFDATLSRVFTYEPLRELNSGKKQSDEEQAKEEICIRSIITWLGLPFLIGLLVSHAALIAGDLGYVVISVAVLAGMFLVMRSIFMQMMCSPKIALCLIGRDKNEREELVGRQVFKYTAWFTLSVLLSQVSMYLNYRLAGKPRELVVFAILTLLCTSVVLISNHVVAVRYEQYRGQAVVAAVVAAALLLFMADRFSPLSVQLMSYFGFGGEPKVELLVTEEGAKIAGDLGLPSCGTRRICNVEILSKMGDEYFLSVQGKTFTLPKTAVESRQSNDRRYRDPVKW